MDAAWWSPCTSGGVLFVAENHSPTLHKVSEIYDRIGFAAVGRYNEFENLRTAGIRLADVRGFSYDRRDVTGRWLANAYAQTLGSIFSEHQKPFEVEAVRRGGGPPAAARTTSCSISYDGSISDEDVVRRDGRRHRVGDHLAARIRSPRVGTWPTRCAPPPSRWARPGRTRRGRCVPTSSRSPFSIGAGSGARSAGSRAHPWSRWWRRRPTPSRRVRRRRPPCRGSRTRRSRRRLSRTVMPDVDVSARGRSSPQWRSRSRAVVPARKGCPFRHPIGQGNESAGGMR